MFIYDLKRNTFMFLCVIKKGEIIITSFNIAIRD
jgi:hypothetical protein